MIMNLAKCQNALEGRDLFPNHGTRCIIHFDAPMSANQVVQDLDPDPSSQLTDASMSMSTSSLDDNSARPQPAGESSLVVENRVNVETTSLPPQSEGMSMSMSINSGNDDDDYTGQIGPIQPSTLTNDDNEDLFMPKISTEDVVKDSRKRKSTEDRDQVASKS